MSQAGFLLTAFFLLGAMIGFAAHSWPDSSPDDANSARPSTHITVNLDLDSWAGGVRAMNLPPQ